MLELIFQGFLEWAYGLALECWEYFSSSLLGIMSMDYAYMKSHVPVMDSIAQMLLAVGWALLIGNLVFQALRSMVSGLGFDGEDPKLLFTRTFVFSFLLLASPQICEIGLNMTAKIMELLEIPDAIDVTLVDEGMFGSLSAAWLLVIIFGIIIMFKVFRLLLEIAERYVILAVLTITAPLAFAMGGSKSTSEIFGGWCRMFGSIVMFNHYKPAELYKIMLEELPAYKELVKCSVFDYVPEWKRREDEEKKSASEKVAGTPQKAPASVPQQVEAAPLQENRRQDAHPAKEGEKSPTRRPKAASIPRQRSGTQCIYDLSGAVETAPEDIGLVEMTRSAIIGGDDPELEELDDPSRIPPGRGI